jgi:methanogenic corrinoid protein MtbC1
VAGHQARLSAKEEREGLGSTPALGRMAHDCPDQSEHQFLAELLRATASELGVRAARRLVDSHPQVAARYEPLPACKWKESFTSWTLELAAALAAGCPSLFARQIAWRRSAFAARGVPIDDIKVGLRILKDTLAGEVPPDDRAVIDAFVAPALCAVDSQSPGCGQGAVPGLCADSKLGELGIRYLVALLEGDRLAASRLIIDEAKAGTPVRDLYLQVLYPAQKELGRMWEQAEIDIAEEHFATAATQMVMTQLYSFLVRKPSNGRVVVAATVSGNQHELGIRMCADFFEMEGWRPVYLGPAVPPEELATAVVTFGADLLVLGACMHTQLQGIGDAIRIVRATPPAEGVKILVGGPGFAETGELWRTMGADAFAHCAADAAEVAERLFATRPADAAPSPAPSRG